MNTAMNDRFVEDTFNLNDCVHCWLSEEFPSFLINCRFRPAGQFCCWTMVVAAVHAAHLAARRNSSFRALKFTMQHSADWLLLGDWAVAWSGTSIRSTLAWDAIWTWPTKTRICRWPKSVTLTFHCVCGTIMCVCKGQGRQLSACTDAPLSLSVKICEQPPISSQPNKN